MKIEQFRYSQGIKHFIPDFARTWNVKEYHDVNAPCYFGGMYHEDDIAIFKRHKGFKILSFTGADAPNIRKFENLEGVVIRTNEETLRILKEYAVCDFNYKIARFGVRKFDLMPVPLGSKIYCYQGNASSGNYYRMDLLKRIVDYFGKEDVIVGIFNKKWQYVYDNYYLNSFVNLQFNANAGYTTVCEMAFMGRMTISNRVEGFCINYCSMTEVIDIIKEQKKNIGKTNDLSPLIDKWIDNTDNWKDTEFWNNGIQSFKIRQ